MTILCVCQLKFNINIREHSDKLHSIDVSDCMFFYIIFQGLERPSIIQQRGIVPLCKGLEVIQ